RMKFLADMGISPRTVAKLRNEGYDAVHLVEEGLEKLEDREILIKARDEGRIVLTVDLDFGQGYFILTIINQEMNFLA
nr:DUF5615 family PIN-like protein [Xenococcaceae cyanobacterium MO_167.B27]